MRDSLRLRFTLLLAAAVLLGASIILALERWSSTRAAIAIVVFAAIAVVPPLCAWGAALALSPLKRLTRALEGAVLNYRDGDFSLSIAQRGHGELGELARIHNSLGDALREQRQNLAQRELLLDTVVQNTPVALVLTDAFQRVVYANVAARQLLGSGRSLLGMDFQALIQDAPDALKAALATRDDSLFSVAGDEGDETFHVSQRVFRLQARPHTLYLLRRMTRELSRQEVATWKRLIRVISHELNNSLAPLSSLAHSGAELARRGAIERVPQVFDAIAVRARHLHSFLDGYARFAKLPSPRIGRVEWETFLGGLAAHAIFVIEGSLPLEPGTFDSGQMEQVLINLLKNAHESGSATHEVRLAVSARRGELQLLVSDRGPGMSDAVLSQALLPFYSTKRAGTGLGLALAREIIEAHGGRITLVNRSDGGLQITLTLPQPEAM